MTDRLLDWAGPIALMVLFASLIAILFGFMLLRSQHNFEKRPTTPGYIVSSEIVKRPVRSQTTGGGRLHLTWLLEIRHAYEVDGKRYETVTRGPQVVMHSAEGRKKPAPPQILKDQLAAYPVGASVTVYYRQSDPSDSVIYIDHHTAKRILSWSFGFLLIALMALWFQRS